MSSGKLFFTRTTTNVIVANVFQYEHKSRKEIFILQRLKPISQCSNRNFVLLGESETNPSYSSWSKMRSV
jgi:hypothetical protein